MDIFHTPPNYEDSSTAIHELQDALEHLILKSADAVIPERTAQLLTSIAATIVQKFVSYTTDNRSPVTILQEVSEILNQLLIVSQLPGIKDIFVRTLTPVVFETITDPCISGWCGREVLRTFNVLVQNSDKKMRHELIEKQNLIHLYRCKLVDLLSVCGDYDYQTSIVECIFRMCSRKQIEEYSKDLIPEDVNLNNAFLAINNETFYSDVRTFLNIINEKSQSVYSIVCTDVLLDNMSLPGPMEFDIRGLWVDFNLKLKSISWYVDGSFSTTDTQELFLLPAESVKNIITEVMDDTIKISLELQGEIITELSRLRHPNHVVFLMEKTEKAKYIATKILREYFINTGLPADSQNDSGSQTRRRRNSNCVSSISVGPKFPNQNQPALPTNFIEITSDEDEDEPLSQIKQYLNAKNLLPLINLDSSEDVVEVLDSMQLLEQNAYQKRKPKRSLYKPLEVTYENSSSSEAFSDSNKKRKVTRKTKKTRNMNVSAGIQYQPIIKTSQTEVVESAEDVDGATLKISEYNEVQEELTRQLRHSRPATVSMTASPISYGAKSFYRMIEDDVKETESVYYTAPLEQSPQNDAQIRTSRAMSDIESVSNDGNIEISHRAPAISKNRKMKKKKTRTVNPKNTARVARKRKPGISKNKQHWKIRLCKAQKAKNTSKNPDNTSSSCSSKEDLSDFSNNLIATTDNASQKAENFIEPIEIVQDIGEIPQKCSIVVEIGKTTLDVVKRPTEITYRKEETSELACSEKEVVGIQDDSETPDGLGNTENEAIERGITEQMSDKIINLLFEVDQVSTLETEGPKKQKEKDADHNRSAKSEVAIQQQDVQVADHNKSKLGEIVSQGKTSVQSADYDMTKQSKVAVDAQVADHDRSTVLQNDTNTADYDIFKLSDNREVIAQQQDVYIADQDTLKPKDIVLQGDTNVQVDTYATDHNMTQQSDNSEVAVGAQVADHDRWSKPSDNSKVSLDAQVVDHDMSKHSNTDEVVVYAQIADHDRWSKQSDSSEVVIDAQVADNDMIKQSDNSEVLDAQAIDHNRSIQSDSSELVVDPQVTGYVMLKPEESEWNEVKIKEEQVLSQTSTVEILYPSQTNTHHGIDTNVEQNELQVTVKLPKMTNGNASDYKLKKKTTKKPELRQNEVELNDELKDNIVTEIMSGTRKPFVRINRMLLTKQMKTTKIKAKIQKASKKPLDSRSKSEDEANSPVVVVRKQIKRKSKHPPVIEDDTPRYRAKELTNCGTSVGPGKETNKREEPNEKVAPTREIVKLNAADAILSPIIVMARDKLKNYKRIREFTESITHQPEEQVRTEAKKRKIIAVENEEDVSAVGEINSEVITTTAVLVKPTKSSGSNEIIEIEEINATKYFEEEGDVRDTFNKSEFNTTRTTTASSKRRKLFDPNDLTYMETLFDIDEQQEEQENASKISDTNKKNKRRYNTETRATVPKKPHKRKQDKLGYSRSVVKKVHKREHKVNQPENEIFNSLYNDYQPSKIEQTKNVPLIDLNTQFEQMKRRFELLQSDSKKETKLYRPFKQKRTKYRRLDYPSTLIFDSKPKTHKVNLNLDEYPLNEPSDNGSIRSQCVLEIPSKPIPEEKKITILSNIVLQKETQVVPHELQTIKTVFNDSEISSKKGPNLIKDTDPSFDDLCMTVSCEHYKDCDAATSQLRDSSTKGGEFIWKWIETGGDSLEARRTLRRGCATICGLVRDTLDQIRGPIPIDVIEEYQVLEQVESICDSLNI